jgi:hypothetical protein
MKTKELQIFWEKVENLMSIKDGKGNSRHFFDIRHVLERFIIRGLEQLRPKTYEMVKQKYNLKGSSEQVEDAFEFVADRFRRDFPEQFTNYLNLAKHLIKQGMEYVISQRADKSGSYVIISKKFQMAIVFAWRPDRHSGGINQAFGQTALNARTLKTLKPDDYKILVEKKYRDYSFARIEEFTFNESPYLEYFAENGKLESTFEFVFVD